MTDVLAQKLAEYIESQERVNALLAELIKELLKEVEDDERD